jgi:DNA-binding NtrC family response regulator
MEGTWMERANRALIVGDMATGREIIARELAEAGFAPFFAEDDVETVELCRARHPDLVVTDHRTPGFDAIELVRRLRAISDVPVVVMTSCGSIPDCEQAMRVGADRFLQFRHDIGRLGDVARDLISIEAPRTRVHERLTTEGARELRRRELRELLQRLVVECRGNIAEIARRMDRDRSTVRYHLRRMDMLE